MKTHSKYQTMDNGAVVETGVFVHENREYAALGSVVDLDRGIIIAYLSNDCTKLQTWSGEVLGSAKVVSRWRIQSHFSTHMFAVRCSVDGIRYHGRNLGGGMVVKLQRSKRA